MQYNIMYRIMVVALCLLGFAGCSEEDMPVKNELGKTVLRVALGPKDIIYDKEDAEFDIEKYVETLHIIGIDQNSERGIDYEVDWDNARKVQEGDDWYAEFTIKEIPAGVYTLYSVANAGDLDWQSSLASATVSAYTSGEQPDLFLMSAINKGQAIDPNNSNNRVTIELIRTVAKIGIGKIAMNGEEKTPTDYKINVSGNLYSTYPLFEGSNTSTETDIDVISTDAPVYLSESNGAVNVTLTVTVDGKEYTGTLAEGEEEIVLKRNNYYALNGTIDEQTQCLLLNISVANWEVLEEWEEQPLSPTYE